MLCLGAGLSSHSSQLSSFRLLMLVLRLAFDCLEDATSDGGGTVKGLPSTSALSLLRYICVFTVPCQVHPIYFGEMYCCPILPDLLVDMDLACA